MIITKNHEYRNLVAVCYKNLLNGLLIAKSKRDVIPKRFPVLHVDCICVFNIDETDFWKGKMSLLQIENSITCHSRNLLNFLL